MSTTIRPRRSVLYMPGAKPRALEKARSLPCDAVIMDLEDAVAPTAKTEAREHVAQALAQGGYGPREIIVRINGLDTPWWQDDLAIALKANPDGILLPKASTADDLATIGKAIDDGGAPPSVRLWAMMETCWGILNVGMMTKAHPRLEGFVMGTNDLAKELHAPFVPGREPWQFSLQLVLLAARAAGLAAIDGVYTNLDDEAGLIAESAQGAAWGFDGKTLIHPKQLEAANAAFAPTDDAVATARAIIAGWDAEDGDSKGVVIVDGRMIEALHVEDARRVVAMAEAIAAL